MIGTNELSAIAGSVLSLIFKYTPKFRVWYENKNGTVKRLIMIAALFVASLIILALACSGILANLNWATLTCDQAGVTHMITLFLYAAAGSQATFLLAPNKKK
jgi:hypothetical protein